MKSVQAKRKNQNNENQNFAIESCYTSVIIDLSPTKDSSLRPMTRIGATRRLSVKRAMREQQVKYLDPAHRASSWTQLARQSKDLAHNAMPQIQLARTHRARRKGPCTLQTTQTRVQQVRSLPRMSASGTERTACSVDICPTNLELAENVNTRDNRVKKK